MSVALLAVGSSLLTAAPSSDYPVFVSELSNPNDYSLFANNGWDGNWYVGYDSCWIKKLPPVPPGDYRRAYLGAKLGRMKTLPPVGRPPEFLPVPGTLFMAVSSTSAWKGDAGVQIADSSMIPLEGSSEFAIEGTGESEWFWAEIPLSQVNFKGDNFLALWTPSPSFVTVSSSPVLAAGWGGKGAGSWIRRDVKGRPPASAAGGPGTEISYFQPAMAMKLIPAGETHPVKVRLMSWKNGTNEQPRPVITADIAGDSIAMGWVEYESKGQWHQVGRPLWKAPFVFSLESKKLPAGKFRLRVAATNIWGESGVSDAFTVEVSLPNEKK